MSGRTWYPTEALRFSLSTKTIQLLDNLAETGLYGRDRGDVARTLINEGIRRAMLAVHRMPARKEIHPHAKRSED